MMSPVRPLLAAALIAACHREAPRASNAPGAPAAADVPPCHLRHDAAAMAPARPLPDTSVYHLDVPLTDQDGRAFHLASLRGHPAVVLMFYGTCQSVCPILTRDMTRVEAALSTEARARTRFVMITLDPENDTPERLRALVAEHHLDLARWSLVRGADSDVRTVATVLGVQYSRLGPGNFTHSNVITALDAQGVAARQLEGLRQPVDDFARAVEGLTP